MKKLIFLFLFMPALCHSYIFVSMDDSQENHLKAYGLAYQSLSMGYPVKWLLNYECGSFLFTTEDSELLTWALTRDVSYEIITESEWLSIQTEIEEGNMTTVDLDVAPSIAVYAPPWNAPWDDAVTLVLEYAEIPYTQIWDEDVLNGVLEIGEYDWLHLHHEDFTGQFGKFWSSYSTEAWYIGQVMEFEEMATELGFESVEAQKKEVAMKIHDFVENGGFLFAMCSATETIDVALATYGLDTVPSQIDSTPMDDWEDLINYENTFAFENFEIEESAWEYSYSEIDVEPVDEGIYYTPFFLTLQEFSAKYDVVASMLVQNHNNVIGGWLGQTTGYHSEFIKKNVTILDTVEGGDWVTYIHGNCGEGTFTFLGGHDPEDYTHYVGDPPTNLELFPNSPGYRLILNNILFPAANTKERKT